MEYRFPVLFFILFLALLSCKKELIMDGSSVYSVRQILRSSNCTAACGQTGLCEGDTTRAFGLFLPNSFDSQKGQFILADINKPQYEIDIWIDSAIQFKLTPRLLQLEGQSVIIRGELGGYDVLTNYACDHRFTLMLRDSLDIQGE